MLELFIVRALLSSKVKAFAPRVEIPKSHGFPNYPPLYYPRPQGSSLIKPI